MPKLPIDDAPLPGAATLAAPDVPEDAGLPPETKDRLARLRAGDDAIERSRMLSHALLDGTRALAAAEAKPGGVEPGFAGSFRDKTERVHAEALRTTPAALRPARQAALDAARDHLVDRAAELEASGRAVRRRLYLRDVLNANAELVRLDAGAIEGAAQRLEELIHTLELPKARQDALRAYVRGVLGDVAVDGLLDDPADAEAALASGQFDAYLDRQAKAARSREIDALLEDQEVKANGRGLLALSKQATQGALDASALEAAVADGRVGAADASRLRSLDANARAEAEARSADVARVVAADGPLDPDSAEDRRAVDAWWDAVKEGFASGDPVQAREAELFVARWRGVVPTALRRKYEGLLLSADPALVASGAEALAELEKIDPRLTRGVAPDRLRLARTVTGFLSLALPADRAVALAKEEVTKTGSTVRTPDPIEGDEEVTEENPEDAGSVPAAVRHAENAMPGIELDAGATVAVDRTLASRVFRTARAFGGFLEELRQLAPEDAIARAREAGLDGNTAQIALDILDAAHRDGDTREAVLRHVARSIKQLPDASETTKRRLMGLLTGVRKLIDDPRRLTHVLAVNRDLFRGRARLANVDPNTSEARRFADFERQTGLIARPVTETLSPQQGDPDDLGDIATRDLGFGPRRIAFFKPGGDTPFVTLPVSVANGLLARPEKAAERLDFFARWRSGDLSGDDLIAEAETLFVQDQSDAFDDNSADVDEVLDREAFDAFAEAKERIEAGEDADAVLAALMPSLIPEAYQDPAAQADLILDMLPIIGGIRAAYAAKKDAEEYLRAKDAGDDAAVREARFSLIFAAAGVIPAAGPLLRNVKPLFLNTLRNRHVARYLRTLPGIRQIHGRFVFPRRFDEVTDVILPADAQAVFGAVYDRFTPRQKSLARGLISNIKGAAAHQELKTLAENAGLMLNRVKGSRTVKLGNKSSRVFDEFAEKGYKILFNTILFPRRGRGGTLFEFKWGNARGSAAQQRKTILIERRLESGELVETVASAEQAAAAAAEAVQLARVKYKDVPEDWLAENTRRLFENSPKREEVGLTDQHINQLVDAVREWHRQVRREELEHINLGQVLMALSMELQALQLAGNGDGGTDGQLEA